MYPEYFSLKSASCTHGNCFFGQKIGLNYKRAKILKLPRLVLQNFVARGRNLWSDIEISQRPGGSAKMSPTAAFHRATESSLWSCPTWCKTSDFSLKYVHVWLSRKASLGLALSFCQCKSEVGWEQNSWSSRRKITSTLVWLKVHQSIDFDFAQFETDRSIDIDWHHACIDPELVVAELF